MGCADIGTLETGEVGPLMPCDDRLIEAESPYEYGLSLTYDGQTPTWDEALVMFRWIEVNPQTVDGFDGYTFELVDLQSGYTIKNFFLYEVTHDTPCSQLDGYQNVDGYCEQDFYDNPISDKVSYEQSVKFYTFRTHRLPQISKVGGPTHINYVAVAAEVEIDPSVPRPEKHFAEMKIGDYHAQLTCK